MDRHAVVLALLSAALFGVSTPAAKALLGEISPTILAGLLYCGAGIGIAILRRVRARASGEAGLSRTGPAVAGRRNHVGRRGRTDLAYDWPVDDRRGHRISTPDA